MARSVALALALVALPALACPVCGVGQGESEWAYIAMTAVLSLLPLAMMGGVAFWLYRRARAHAQALELELGKGRSGG